MSHLSIDATDCNVYQGQIFTDKYSVIKKIGSGGFSSVWMCSVLVANSQTDQVASDPLIYNPLAIASESTKRKSKQIALKIHKTGRNYYMSARNELHILRDIKHQNIISPIDNFMYRDESATTRKHYCLVYELCDYDLFTLMEKHNFNPLNQQYIKLIMQDILMGLKILHTHRIIHSDIKPENILFKDGIGKIADFSTADWEYRYESGTVGTRYYRAPEVLLGINLTTAIDIWSAGCILFEMVTGNRLFEPNSYVPWGISSIEDHIVQIIELGQPIPAYMINGHDGYKYFKRGSDGATTKHIEKIKTIPIKNILYGDGNGDGSSVQTLTPEQNSLCDLLEQMLQVDPVKRISAAACLEHSYLIAQLS